MKHFYASIFAVTLALSASSASAAIVSCPTTPLANPNDYFMNLTTPAGITASCHDYGGPNNGFPSIVNNNTVTFMNDSVELPTGTSTTAVQTDGGAGGAFSGFNSGGTTGTVTFLKNAASPLYLLFKFGGGQNTPHFFVYKLTGVNASEAVSWVVDDTNGGVLNGLSGIRLYGNVTTSNTCTTPGGCDPLDVPEPTSVALLGLGLLGAGIARRRKQ